MTAAIPRAIFILVGGAFSDRFSPRTLMLVSNAIRGVVVGIMAALVLTGQAELWHLYVLAAIFGVVDAFFYPALNTIIPMLVSERQLPAANAAIQGSVQVMGLIGPALAGAAIALVQTGPAFAIDAACFGVAALAVFLVRGGRRAAPPSDERPSSRTSSPASPAACGAAWADPAVRGTLVLIDRLQPRLHRTARASAWRGWPRSGSRRARQGSASSSPLGRRRADRRHPGRLDPAAAALRDGAALDRLPARRRSRGDRHRAEHGRRASRSSAPMAVLIGFTNVQYISWLQRRVPEELRGRVMSLVMLASIGLAPVSLAAAGALVDLGAATLMYRRGRRNRPRRRRSSASPGGVPGPHGPGAGAG